LQKPGGEINTSGASPGADTFIEKYWLYLRSESKGPQQYDTVGRIKQNVK
jgi:hypothetical protein